MSGTEHLTIPQKINLTIREAAEYSKIEINKKEKILKEILIHGKRFKRS